MDINEVKNILKEINYPGFSRDIVSFGMVENIDIQNSTIIIHLKINSDNEELLKNLKNDIIKKISQKSSKEIEVNIAKPTNDSSNQSNHQTSPSTTTIPGVKNIIAIASGKGGVGKSTITINIAASLSKNYKVGVLDLDIYGPSLPMLVGLNKQPKITNDQKLIPLEKYDMKLMSFGFINSENAPAVWRGPMVSRMTQQFFDDVNWGDLDFLLLDLPPGTGDIQLTLVQKLALTGAIMITTPQELALLDVKKGADMFSKVNTSVLGVIENMTHFLCPHCNQTSKFFPGSGGKEESKRLDVPLLGQIYLNPDIAKCSDGGTPYVLKYKDSLITKEYFNIASQINNLIN